MCRMHTTLEGIASDSSRNVSHPMCTDVQSIEKFMIFFNPANRFCYEIFFWKLWRLLMLFRLQNGSTCSRHKIKMQYWIENYYGLLLSEIYLIFFLMFLNWEEIHTHKYNLHYMVMISMVSDSEKKNKQATKKRNAGVNIIISYKQVLKI